MRVFIVGATGVIGRRLVPRLLARGDEVVALVRSLERATAIAGPGVELFEGDLLHQDPEQLGRMLKGCDAAAHLATALRPGSPGLGTTNTNAALRTDGTRLLVAAVQQAGVPRYIQQSITMSYIDGGDTWLNEQTPFFQGADPRTSSGPVVEMEAMVQALDPEKVAWAVLRGGSFVGPETREDAVIAGLRSGSVHVPGDGSNWVSLVHVWDYAEAVELAIHSEVRGAVFNITDEPIRNGDYLDRLGAILKVPAPPRNLTAAAPRSYRCTSAAAKLALGWTPTHGIWPSGDQIS